MDDKWRDQTRFTNVLLSSAPSYTGQKGTTSMTTLLKTAFVSLAIAAASFVPLQASASDFLLTPDDEVEFDVVEEIEDIEDIEVAEADIPAHPRNMPDGTVSFDLDAGTGTGPDDDVGTLAKP